ncbi:TPR repeat protein [Streptomyces sp. CEV 2-1]|uniref:tetratricopeptide repeat protein n=1 Tax=Streptomyces sp. CEV 2-1 TaxID=2485153 RepID=UPI000F9E17C1|nr:sel1 repeat family protein [Streptomyces sp. CEV 2-1]ROQ65213.1 TPR repeat protein [Streptomyces sp. CEV 2-1]
MTDGSTFNGPTALQSGNGNVQHITFVSTDASVGGTVDKPRQVERWTAQELGVHPAISGTSGPTVDGAFVLPEYLEREHDGQLRARLDEAAAGQRTALLVVRGESCTGKTRTAFEGVRSCLAKWNLVFPKTVGDLLAVLRSPALAERTVLWLNEIQEYLTGPHGEEAAAALRNRLELPGPVVIVATLWPIHHHALTATAEFGTVDAHPQARALLSPSTPIDVPGSFAAQALRSLVDCRDPSVAIAARTSPGGTVIQTLAAGPQLVDHYEQAVGPHGPYGRAIIAAAMDARRLGHNAVLPTALLRAAAPGYLSDDQRAAAADSWFADALGFARTKVKGVVAALEPVADPNGMGALPEVYRLADYLDHHARLSRRYRFPPGSFWTAALGCSTPDVLHLAAAARFRSRYKIAATLYRRGADAGDTGALLELAALRGRVGDLAGAEQLYQQAADGGDTRGLLELAALRGRVGDLAGAEQLYQQAADGGDTRGLLELAGWRRRVGDVAGAEQLYQQAAAAGDTGALRSLEDLRQAALDLECAVREYWRAGGTSTAAVRELAGWRRRIGDREGAERLLRQAADGGDTSALWRLAEIRAQAGDAEGAEQLYLHAIQADGTGALLGLARHRGELGDTDCAERLYRQAADSGDARGLLELAALRAREGDLAGAERLYRQAAAAGALLDLAELRQVSGGLDRAALEFERNADAERTGALLELARQREQVNDLAGAESLYRLAAAAGTPLFGQLVFLQMRSRDAELAAAEADGVEAGALSAPQAPDTGLLLRLASLSHRGGDAAGAERAALQAANVGDPGALVTLAALKERVGDREGAAVLLRFGLAADGSAVGPWEV